MKIIFTFLFVFIFCTISFSQTIYYSVNGTTNPNSLNSWTQDPTGNTILFPPSSFSGFSDIFIIDGENMNITAEWNVAGEVRVYGSLSDGDRFKFRARTFSIYNNTSYLFIGNAGDAHFDTLIIGPLGHLNTGNSFQGNGIRIDSICIINGTLLDTEPIIGSGRFVVNDGATLHLINGGISKSGNTGNIQLTGTRELSKSSNYVFEFNVGSFETGDGLPDTVANLTINNGDNTSATLTSSTTVTGTLLSAGSFGGTNNNSSVSIGSSTLNCLGNINFLGSVILNSNEQGTLLISGPVNDITLPPSNIDNLVLDRNSKITLAGNLTIAGKFTFKQGFVYTQNNVIQLGNISEALLQYSNGRIIGTFARIKDKDSISSLYFPVGTENKDRSVKITYTSAPSSSGLIKVKYNDLSGLSVISPSILDSNYSINYKLNMNWQVTPILISGGAFDVAINIAEEQAVQNLSSLRLLVASGTSSQPYIIGQHKIGDSLTVQREGMSGSEAFGYYYLGGDSILRLTSIESDMRNINRFNLSQNYPNPFNPITKITFSLPVKSFITLNVYDLLGQLVDTIISEEMTAGNYIKTWNAENIPSGVYFYILQSDSFSETKKLILLK